MLLPSRECHASYCMTHTQKAICSSILEYNQILLLPRDRETEKDVLVEIGGIAPGQT